MPQLRLLLADDNAFSREISLELLDRHFDFTEVEWVTDGLQAVEKISSRDFDLVLMDIQMPEMNGMEATRYIRNKMEVEKRNIPIIALTSSTTPEIVHEAMSSGMNGHLVKPFNPEDLAKILLEIFNDMEMNSHNTKPAKPETGIADEEENSLFDLVFLRDFCEGDEEQMRYFLEKFKKQWPLEMEKMRSALHHPDREAVIKGAHAFRPQLDFVGLKDDAELVFNLEHSARNHRGFDELREIFNGLRGWQK